MSYLTDRTRRVIRAGTDVIEAIPAPITIDQGATLIGADTLDTVRLRHLGAPTMVMLVDDGGHARGRPVNTMATHLYWANCVPGTTHEIRGDVVIAPDSDFGSGHVV